MQASQALRGFSKEVLSLTAREHIQSGYMTDTYVYNALRDAFIDSVKDELVVNMLLIAQ